VTATKAPSQYEMLKISNLQSKSGTIVVNYGTMHFFFLE